METFTADFLVLYITNQKIATLRRIFFCKIRAKREESGAFMEISGNACIRGNAKAPLSTDSGAKFSIQPINYSRVEKCLMVRNI